MGTPGFARVILEDLYRARGVCVKAVFTMPDKRVGRKQILTPTEVKSFALEHQTPVFETAKIADSELESLRDLAPDFIVVAAYGVILPRAVLEMAPCINLHASVLPRYRGAAPIEAAIINGDETFGVTAMLMNEGLDTGEILGLSLLKNSGQNAVDLTLSLAQKAGALIVQILERFGGLAPLSQRDCDASSTKKISKTDTTADFSDAGVLYKKFLAFGVKRGLYVAGGLKITGLDLVSAGSRAPRHEKPVIKSIEKQAIVVGCLVGEVRILTLIPPSKAQMDAASYARGQRLKVGDFIL